MWKKFLGPYRPRQSLPIEDLYRLFIHRQRVDCPLSRGTEWKVFRGIGPVINKRFYFHKCALEYLLSSEDLFLYLAKTLRQYLTYKGLYSGI